MILTGNWSHTCTQPEAMKILNKPKTMLDRWRAGGVGPLARRGDDGELEYSIRNTYEYRDLIDVKEAAEFLGVTPETVRRHIPVDREMCGINYYRTGAVWAYYDGDLADVTQVEKDELGY